MSAYGLQNFIDNHCGVCERFVKTIGCGFGWLGVICRTAGIVISSYALTRVDLSGSITILLIVTIAYLFSTLAVNLLSVVGISQEKPNYLLPYLTIIIFETTCGIIGLVAAIVYLGAIKDGVTLSYAVPVAIVVLTLELKSFIRISAIYGIMWWQLNTLYKHLKAVDRERAEDKDSPPEDGVLQLFRSYFRPSRHSFNLREVA